jgi:hypothetical protein
MTSSWDQELRLVIRSELSGQLAGDALIETCTALARRLQGSSEVSTIPHEVWHYLSDADIRSKDKRYAEAQLQRIIEVMPPPRG